jgi:hypothetical protein
MKSPSDQIDQALSDLAATVACKEREGCAELVQQMADAEEDPTRKDLLNDVVVAIRRMPYKKYQ